MSHIKTIVGMIGICALTTFAHAQMESNGQQPMGQSGQQMRRPGPGQMMQEADTNHDGKVSKEEFLAQAAKHFTKMDRNGDGYLTKDDRPSGGQEQGPGGEEQGPPQE